MDKLTTDEKVYLIALVIFLVLSVLFAFGRDDSTYRICILGGILGMGLAGYFHITAMMPYTKSINKKPSISHAGMTDTLSVEIICSEFSFSHKPFVVTIDGNEVAKTYHGKTIVVNVQRNENEISVSQENKRTAHLKISITGDSKLFISSAKSGMIYLTDSVEDYAEHQKNARALHRSSIVRTIAYMAIADSIMFVLVLIIFAIGGVL